MITAVGAHGQSDASCCVQLSDQTAVENEPQNTYSSKPVSTVDRYSLLSNDIPSVLGTRYTAVFVTFLSSHYWYHTSSWQLDE